jgi:serine phosphatase RsbU (regulator of sigma subunit)/HAMP domain-containing protein
MFVYTISVGNGAKDTLESSIESNTHYTQIVEPTVSGLEYLETDLIDLSFHVNNWVYNTTNDLTSLHAMNLILDTLINTDTLALNEVAEKWGEENTDDIEVYKEIKSDLVVLKDDIDFNIRTVLTDFASKTDVTNLFMAQTAIDDINPKLDDILGKLHKLVQKKKDESEEQKKNINSKFSATSDSLSFLSTLIIVALVVLVVSTLVIALFTTRSITRPVTQLKGILINLGKGIFPRQKVDPSNDEIGEMSVAMNQLVDGLKRTTDFANEVGKSNFDYPYTPLSSEDVLGHALVKMRDELAENERILEQKVKERTAEVVRQKEEIERQSEKLEELYKDVTDSIRYAKRLQDSILPQNSFIERLLPESFVLFKPKDIVSGDFYWVSETEDKVLFSAVDCTGHGVPGAFMSLIGANALNQIINEREDKPANILNKLNKLSSEALNKSEEEVKVRDGMDLALCAISKDFKTLEYAGANNPLYLVRDGEITVTKADKLAIASFEDGKHHYTNHEFELKKGDLVYIFSDGYADQFGGVKGKKFMYRQFRELLVSIKDEPMDKQKEILNQKIEDWKGTFEQVDDILVIGVRI